MRQSGCLNSAHSQCPAAVLCAAAWRSPVEPAQHQRPHCWPVVLIWRCCSAAAPAVACCSAAVSLVCLGMRQKRAEGWQHGTLRDAAAIQMQGRLLLLPQKMPLCFSLETPTVLYNGRCFYAHARVAAVAAAVNNHIILCICLPAAAVADHCQLELQHNMVAALPCCSSSSLTARQPCRVKVWVNSLLVPLRLDLQQRGLRIHN